MGQKIAIATKAIVKAPKACGAGSKPLAWRAAQTGNPVMMAARPPVKTPRLYSRVISPPQSPVERLPSRLPNTAE